MLKRYSTNYAIFCAFLDGLLVIISLNLANVIRPELSPLFSFVRNINFPQTINISVYIAVAVIWVAVFIKIGIYDPEKNLRVIDEFYNLILGTFISLIVISGAFYLVNSRISRFLFLIFGFITFAFQLIHRIAYRLITRNNKTKAFQPESILIAGAGTVGRRFENEIKKYAYLGYDVVGFIDDDPDLVREKADVLGGIEQAINLIQTHDVDKLVIALPKWADKRISYLVETVHKLPVQVWVIPDYFSLMLIKSSVSDIGNIPLINLRAPALSIKQRITKRIFDMALTIPAFILTLPVFGLIALLIKLDSEGPIFYESPRLKESGKVFKMIKFRTMVKNAHEKLQEVMREDENGNVIHKVPDDPRITRVGKFLRKTSLDELPQLINIFKGDMSLVGPRPELPEMVQHYHPWQYKRFATPQGLTGWWQINGRSDKPMHLHTEDDLYYIQNYSIWLDLQILFKTVLIVLRGKGAY